MSQYKKTTEEKTVERVTSDPSVDTFALNKQFFSSFAKVVGDIGTNYAIFNFGGVNSVSASDFLSSTTGAKAWNTFLNATPAVTNSASYVMGSQTFKDGYQAFFSSVSPSADPTPEELQELNDLNVKVQAAKTELVAANNVALNAYNNLGPTEPYTDWLKDATGGYAYYVVILQRQSDLDTATANYTNYQASLSKFPALTEAEDRFSNHKNELIASSPNINLLNTWISSGTPSSPAQVFTFSYTTKSFDQNNWTQGGSSSGSYPFFGYYNSETKTYSSLIQTDTTYNVQVAFDYYGAFQVNDIPWYYGPVVSLYKNGPFLPNQPWTWGPPSCPYMYQPSTIYIGLGVVYTIQLDQKTYTTVKEVYTKSSEFSIFGIGFGGYQQKAYTSWSFSESNYTITINDRSRKQPVLIAGIYECVNWSYGQQNSKALAKKIALERLISNKFDVVIPSDYRFSAVVDNLSILNWTVGEKKKEDNGQLVQYNSRKYTVYVHFIGNSNQVRMITSKNQGELIELQPKFQTGVTLNDLSRFCYENNFKIWGKFLEKLSKA